MKKLLIFLALGLFISIGVLAQNNKRTSAYMYNKNKQYIRAKEAIDEAITHPKTAEDAKTWMYRGIIYYNISRDTTPELQTLAPDAATVAVESFAKAKEFDTKDSFDGEIALYLINLTNQFYQLGAGNFQNSEWDEAIVNFKQAFEIAQMDNNFDTVAAFNVGMSAVLGDKPEIAAEYMKKCIEVDMREPRVYMYYAKAEKQMGDTTAAFDILAKGREKFPNDNSLQLEEAQLYLETGTFDKLIVSLKEAIEADPTNTTLYLVLGQSYENVDDTENALEIYKKAVEIDPVYADAIFNIGAIYVNRASELYNEANNLPFEETKKYEELKSIADENLHLALPYLEKSLELNPGDQIIIMALKEAYANLKMNDKLKELMDK